MFKKLCIKLIEKIFKLSGVGKITLEAYKSGVCRSVIFFEKIEENTTNWVSLTTSDNDNQISYTVNGYSVEGSSYGDHVMVDGRCRTV